MGQTELIVPLPKYECYIVELSNLDIVLVSDFNEKTVPFATVDRSREVIVIKTDNQGFEGLHDISVVVQIPEFEKPHSSSPIKAIRNCQAKFRVEIFTDVSRSHLTERSRQPRGLALDNPKI